MGERTAVAAPPHLPVLLDRTVELLATAAPGVLVDATVGAGGHAAALLAASGPDVVLVGFDRDADALDLAADRLAPYGDRARLVHAAYDELGQRLAPVVADAGPVRGVLYDLGVSSMQLDRGDRGFSFRTDAPLDMRMDRSAGASAADLVNTAEAEELAHIIRRYGEERFAVRVARAIVAARPLRTTGALAAVVADAVPARSRVPGVHPATRTFQALRIAVNTELERLSASLPQALGLLAPAPDEPSPETPGEAAAGARGGRIAVLSYHSLEDRIVKRFFSDAAAGCICPPDLPVCGCGRVPILRHLTRGIERPGADEVAANPRARSAKLRAAERTGSEL